ncbi:MAG: response regulator [Ignavibacteriaceae bacterium]|nr:response regulator [Ignavibacteriaceae bacterium]
MSVVAKILLFDDDLRSLSLLTDGLAERGLIPEIKPVKTLTDFVNALDEFKPEAVLINYRQSSYESLTALALTRKKNPLYPFVFIFADEPVHYHLKHRISSQLANEEFRTLSESVKGIFDDISQRKSMEQRQHLADTELALEKEKEEAARGILKSSPSLILLYDKEGNYIERFLSPDSPFAYPAPEFFEKNLNDILNSGDVVKIKELTGKGFELYEFTTGSGADKRVLMLQVLTTSQEQLILYVADITRERALAGELRNLKQLISSSASQYILLNGSWGIELVSQGIEQFLGWGEGIKSRSIDDLLPDLVPGLTAQQVAIGLELDSSWTEVYQYRSEDKKEKMAAVSANKVEAGGNLAAILISITDLSEWKERENEFRLDSAKYRAITENLNLGIIALRDHRIYYANEFFCSLLEMKAEAVIGSDFNEILVKEDRKLFEDTVRTLLAEERTHSAAELRLMHANGISVVNTEISLKLSKFDGAFTIFCVIKDQSEAKLHAMIVENQISTSSNLSQTSSTPKEHDLRTSLNGIIGFAEIIREHFKDKSEEEFLNIADQILNNGKHLMEVLELGPSLETAKGQPMALEINTVLLSELLSKTLESVKGGSSKKEIRLNFLYSTKIEVLADEKKLYQLILALIKNSYDSPVESTINVETGYDGAKGKAYIRIKDSGIRIDEKLVPLLFKPMAGETSKRYPELYKLGVIVYPAQHLIQQMNGELSVLSKAETGVSVTVYLPVPEKKESAKVNLGNSLVAVSTELVMLTELNPVILIVEDDPGCAKMLQITFRNLTKTDIAVNGDEALDFIAGRAATGQTYDLLLLDIGLPPPWDGILLRKEILTRYPQYENVPILAETAFAMKADVSRITAAGFDAYIAKPIDRRYLIKTMVAALKKYNRL